jgi:hypothetical protein
MTVSESSRLVGVWVTVTAAVPFAEPAEAVTVDVPGPTAVTTPEDETVATPRSDAVQVIVSLLITFPC